MGTSGIQISDQEDQRYTLIGAVVHEGGGGGDMICPQLISLMPASVGENR